MRSQQYTFKPEMVQNCGLPFGCQPRAAPLTRAFADRVRSEPSALLRLSSRSRQKRQDSDSPPVHRWSRMMTGIEHLTSEMERVMQSESEGSAWASVVAVLAVTGALGALYLPLVLR